MRCSKLRQNCELNFPEPSYLTLNKPSRNLKAPSKLQNVSLATLLEALEEFWDSEEPRLGEEGAQGWSTSISQPASSLAPIRPDQSQPNVMQDANSDPYAAWSAIERSRDETFHLPSRTADEDDDPYATVLFADVKPFLFILGSQDTGHTFRLLWLNFLGLHVPGFSLGGGQDGDASASSDAKWAATHLSGRAYLDALFPSPEEARRRIVAADAQAGVLVGREREFMARAFENPVKEWALSVFGPLELLAPGSAWWWREEDIQDVDVAFVRCVFKQCRFAREDSDWDILALAFEATINVKR
jgi:hypothetical protein